MDNLKIRSFSGPDDLFYSARDLTDDEGRQTVDVDVFHILNAAPAWLTGAERLLLFTLIYSLRPARYLEIGVLEGGSAMIVDKAMDAAGHDGKLILVDPKPEIEPLLWKKLSSRSLLLQGFSPQVLSEAREVAGGPFDFVLIDAGHTTQAVLRDAEGVLPYLEDGAYLLFHDSYRPAVALGIDLFLQTHVSSLVDFGHLTRDFANSKPMDQEGQNTDSVSCGFRILQVRRGHGRRFLVDRWRGSVGRFRRWAGRIRRERRPEA